DFFKGLGEFRQRAKKQPVPRLGRLHWRFFLQAFLGDPGTDLFGTDGPVFPAVLAHHGVLRLCVHVGSFAGSADPPAPGSEQNPRLVLAINSSMALDAGPLKVVCAAATAS